MKSSVMKSSLLWVSVAGILTLSACQPNEQQTEQQHDQQTPTPSAVLWPKLQSSIAPDASLEKRLSDILAKMTTEQKVAQIIQPEIRDMSVDDMRRYGFGSYLNGGGAFPNNNKMASAAEWVAFAEAMYQASIDDSLDGSNIPTMWATDAVHGHNNVIGATLFPHNIGLGASHDPALIERIASATAIEVAATGIDWVFAPTVAVARDIRWGRSYESYSENPELVRHYAHAFIRGMQGTQDQTLDQQHVIATLKHFIGDGGTDNGDDQGDTRVSEQELFTVHASGYLSGIEAGAQTIMASFNSWNGEKAHGHRYLLTDVLKQKMGFDGLVVGDWNGHGQIPNCSNEHCAEALNAGVDIFMAPGKSWQALYNNTLLDIANNKIPMSRLDDAVARVLRVKLRAGLFDKPSPAKRALSGDSSVIGNAAHRQLAREAVRKSLVLLKNHNQLLPLSPKQRFLVSGDAADNIGKQSGGWSITWQGNGNTNADFPGATSIYEGLRQAITAAGGHIELKANGEYQQKPDVAIMVFGEEPYAEGNGDLDNLDYQRGKKSDLALLQKWHAQGIPVVAIFISGRPLWMNAELNAADAFVAAWLPGTEGAGVADVILRQANGEKRFDFTGRLPFAWPSQPHVDEASKRSPLLAYGTGLRYGDDALLAQNLPVIATTTETSLSTLHLLEREVKAPWKLFIGTDAQLKQVTSNTQTQGPVAIRTIDKLVQEDARQIHFDGSAQSQLALRSDFPNDWRGYLAQDSAILFDVQLTQFDNAPIHLALSCGTHCGAQVSLTTLLNSLPKNEWSSVSVALRCFDGEQMNFAQVFTPFSLHSQAALQFNIANIRLQASAAKTAQLTCE